MKLRASLGPVRANNAQRFQGRLVVANAKRFGPSTKFGSRLESFERLGLKTDERQMQYGSTAVTSFGTIRGDAPGTIIPVAFKRWINDQEEEDHFGRTALTVHNNYVNLRRLKKQGVIKHLVVPRLYGSYLWLKDGNDILIIELPVDKVLVREKITKKRTRIIFNQSLVVDDLTEQGKFALLDVKDPKCSTDQVCYVAGEDIDKIARRIKRREGSNPGLAMAEADIELTQALFSRMIAHELMDIAIGDIDKVDPIILADNPPHTLCVNFDF